MGDHSQPRHQQDIGNAGYLAGCINEMLTVRNRNERAVTEMLKNNTLAELSALCAVSAEMDAVK